MLACFFAIIQMNMNPLLNNIIAFLCPCDMRSTGHKTWAFETRNQFRESTQTKYFTLAALEALYMLLFKEEKP